MTWKEALSLELAEGADNSKTPVVLDKFDNAHWIEFNVQGGDDPNLETEAGDYGPFSPLGEPYRRA